MIGWKWRHPHAFICSSLQQSVVVLAVRDPLIAESIIWRCCGLISKNWCQSSFQQEQGTDACSCCSAFAPAAPHQARVVHPAVPCLHQYCKPPPASGNPHARPPWLWMEDAQAFLRQTARCRCLTVLAYGCRTHLLYCPHTVISHPTTPKLGQRVRLEAAPHAEPTFTQPVSTQPVPLSHSASRMF